MKGLGAFGAWAYTTDNDGSIGWNVDVILADGELTHGVGVLKSLGGLR